MTISISPMSRVGVGFGAYDAGADEIAFDVPADVAAGDQMLVLIGLATDPSNLATQPDGWALLSTEDVDSFTWSLFGKVAEAADLGATATWADLPTEVPVGVIVAYRGGAAGAPLVASIDPFDVVYHGAGTTHAMPEVDDGTTQTTDVILSFLWVMSNSVTVTVPTLPDGCELIGSSDDADARRRVFELADGTIGAHGGGFDITTSGACSSSGAAVALRARRLRAPVGLRDAIPGHVGLERDAAGPVP